MQAIEGERAIEGEHGRAAWEQVLVVLVIFVVGAQIPRPRENHARAELVLSPFMAYRFLLIRVLLLALADPAVANWWIVRAADEKCLVVDIEPSPNNKDVTKVGKNVYETQEQAEADVKRLCKETNAPPPNPATDK